MKQLSWPNLDPRLGGSQGGSRVAAGMIAGNHENRCMTPHLAASLCGAGILYARSVLGEWILAHAMGGYDGVGMDISQPTIDQLVEVLPTVGFVFGDIRRTGHPDASFDAYFSWGLFEHFEAGLGDCHREVLRTFKPGGILFISIPIDNLRQSVLGTFAPDQKELRSACENFVSSFDRPYDKRLIDFVAKVNEGRNA